MRTEHQQVIHELVAAPNSRRLLLVDENIEDLNAHSALFEQLGFEVYKCPSYDTAMRLVERADFEFAVVDQGSPAFDALPLLHHLNRFSPNTPFIVIARFKDISCYLEALEAGTLDYFEKPLSIEEMKRLIRLFLNPQAHANRNPTNKICDA